MTKTFTAEPFFEPDDDQLRFLPEGPRAPRAVPGKLGWVAIQHAAESHVGSFNILDLITRHNEQFVLDGRPGFFAETMTPGVLLIGLERRLVLFDAKRGKVGETLVDVPCREDVIINDGLAVAGGVLFGTKHLKFDEPAAALYFFNTLTSRLHVVVDRQICSNGKFLKGDVLIDIDSTPKTITRYRLDAGLERVIEQSLIVAPDTLPALPDGLRPTPEGDRVVVAFYNPAHVADGVAQEISIADGSVGCQWIIPGSPRVTCPEFVELDGRVRIVFTTAVEGMDAATRAISPHAGCWFIADTPYDRVPDCPPLVKI